MRWSTHDNSGKWMKKFALFPRRIQEAKAEGKPSLWVWLEPYWERVYMERHENGYLFWYRERRTSDGIIGDPEVPLGWNFD